MDSRIGNYQYRVDPFDGDCLGQLSWSVLGRRILSVATYHAGERGFDHLEIDGVPYLWVLSRLTIEMDHRPMVGETYTIRTWVGGYYRQFTDRLYEVVDGGGRVIGRVVTVWAMISSATRQPADITALFGHTMDPYVCAEACFKLAPVRRAKVAADARSMSVTARYTDIDINGHVNSISYIEYMLGCFPQEYYRTHEVSRIEVAYSSEAFCGDALDVTYASADGLCYGMDIRHHEHPDTTVCRGMLSFRDTSVNMTTTKQS